MPKKSPPRRAPLVTPRRKPQPTPLPGMEDHAIPALDALAQQYADIRDQRMQLTVLEKALRANTVAAMHKHGKTVYMHDGITITLVSGNEDVRMRVKPPAMFGDDDADSRGNVWGDD